LSSKNAPDATAEFDITPVLSTDSPDIDAMVILKIELSRRYPIRNKFLNFYLYIPFLAVPYGLLPVIIAIKFASMVFTYLPPNAGTKIELA
jgi:hypothetical protein